MKIGEEISQEKFKSEYGKAVVNVIFTNSWLQQKHLSIFKSFGLTTPQFNILRILRGQQPKPATVNLLIDRMLDKSSNASRIVDKLEEKGLVKRIQCKNDRRAVDVYISESGLALLSKLDTVLEDLQEKFQNLTEEESKVLNELLDKMRS